MVRKIAAVRKDPKVGFALFRARGRRSFVHSRTNRQVAYSSCAIASAAFVVGVIGEITLF